MEVKVNEAVFFAIFSLSTFQFCYFHIIKILVTSMATILRQLKVEIRPPLFFQKLYYNLMFRFILVQL